MKSIVERILFQIRLKSYPLLHSLSCDGEMKIYIPNDTNADRECYMKCAVCDKKYHILNVERDDWITRPLPFTVSGGTAAGFLYPARINLLQTRVRARNGYRYSDIPRSKKHIQTAPPSMTYTVTSAAQLWIVGVFQNMHERNGQCRSRPEHKMIIRYPWEWHRRSQCAFLSVLK